MLTAAQSSRAVDAITSALTRGHYCDHDVAIERARNLVTALLYPVDADERHSIVAGVLLTRKHEIRDFWRAVDVVELAFVMALQDSNGERFKTLIASGHTGEDAQSLLASLGFVAPVRGEVHA